MPLLRAFICPNERIMRLLQQTPDDPGFPCHEMVEDVVPKIQFDHRIMNVSYPPFPLGLRFLHLSNVSVNFDQKLAQTSFVLLESLTCRLPPSVFHSGRYQRRIRQILDICQPFWCLKPESILMSSWRRFGFHSLINSKFEQSLSIELPGVQRKASGGLREAPREDKPFYAVQPLRIVLCVR